jgi:hypothetical protein
LLGLLVVGGALAFAVATSRRRGARRLREPMPTPRPAEKPDELAVLREKLGRSGSEIDALKAKLGAESRPQDVDVLKTKGADEDLDAVHLLLAKLEPPARPRPQLRPVPTPPQRSRRPKSPDDCRVRWWRGYVKSEFYAATSDDDEERTVAASPSFRWHGVEPPPEAEPATTALAALVAQLERDGWQLAGRGDEWFELRFRRHAVSTAEPRADTTTTTKGS